MQGNYVTSFNRLVVREKLKFYSEDKLGFSMVIVKKSFIIVLQIITLLLVVSDHFLALVFNYSQLFFFGVEVSIFIMDVILYITIGLQITIIVLLIEGVKE